jgi:hypothetical protein
MKLRFKKSVVIDVQKARIDELWDKQYRRWDEINIETINPNPDKKTSHVITSDGDVLLFVPVDAYEVI